MEEEVVSSSLRDSISSLRALCSLFRQFVVAPLQPGPEENGRSTIRPDHKYKSEEWQARGEVAGRWTALHNLTGSGGSSLPRMLLLQGVKALRRELSDLFEALKASELVATLGFALWLATTFNLMLAAPRCVLVAPLLNFA